jgi:hypothetical protein
MSVLGKLTGTAGLLAGLVATGCSSQAADSGGATSDAQENYTADAMPAEVNRRVEMCFVRNWSHDVLRVSNVDDVWGGTRSTIPVVTQITEAMAWVIDNVGHLVLHGSQGEQVIQNLIGSLKQISQEQSLTDFQQVEVVLCVSSNLISYADTGVKTWLGSDEAVNVYQGVCREYAEIAARLMKAIGLDGSFIDGVVNENDGTGSGGHAWDQVTLPSQATTYWIEPQDDPISDSRAVFFHPRQ